MGLGSYFKRPQKPEAQEEQQQQQISEKTTSTTITGNANTNTSNNGSMFLSAPSPTNDMELQPPTPQYAGSVSGQSTRSSGTGSIFLDDIRHEVMCNYIYQQQCTALWVSDGSGDVEGCILRKTRGIYLSCPPQLVTSPLGEALSALNVQCAITVNSRVIRSFMAYQPDATEVPITSGLKVQILPGIEELARARKHQFAAYLASEALLVVWDDDPLNLMNRAKRLEAQITALAWRMAEGGDQTPGAAAEEEEDEENSEEKVADEMLDEKYKTKERKEDAEKAKKWKKGDKEKVVTRVTASIDPESGEVLPESRPVHMLNTYLVSIVLCMVVTSIGAAWRQLAIGIAIDNTYTRLALVALAPIQIFFTLFFAQVIVGCLAQIFGPINQLQVNSKFFSAQLPARLRTRNLPHVTVQAPVYKEGLAGVIEPTVRSLKAAISTYELQGGSANIFVNDDGLQLIPEEERRKRIEFYADHNIGWVARPKHGVNGFERRGKFKKASNMNFALMISNKVEEALAQIDRHPEWSQVDEALAYEACLKQVLADDGRAWADGNIRVGDYILIIDSDTRVPSDCLLDAVSEMEQSPEVGIMQFSSGVMQVTWDYFENGITFFTNLIYSAIRYTVSNGDVAPFVGHNAILRWSAIQQVSYQDDDGYDKFWSESHVSEDFDMSLRLQCAGYIIRLAAWAADGFQEGVSLTVYDELARWEKYAYGCNELLFHPIRTWLWRGPFTPLFRRFLFSNIRFTSKVTVISYIGTYYAIGAAWVLTSANYFLMGWMNGYLDKYYLDSWQVWFSIIIVFNGLGNVALAIMRYRAGEKELLRALWENFKWTFCLAIFLGGLSLHVSQALLAHMFEIDMQWGATSKEAERSNFFLEVPKLAKSFKWSMLFSLTFIVGMIILAVGDFVPYDWRITDFVAILPMATVAVSHFLLPIALNPALMTFSW